jgi:hypothetical protein
MKAVIISCFLSLALFTTSAAAGEKREIELKDGSVVSGEVLSLTNGIYTIRSDSLGTVKLEESKVRAIRSIPPVTSGASAEAVSASAGEVRSLQEKMMSDKEVMGMIQSLQNDPDFQKLLEDPEVLKAVQAGDIATLLGNPKFMNLLNNPTVKDIQKKVK